MYYFWNQTLFATNDGKASDDTLLKNQLDACFTQVLVVFLLNYDSF